MYFRKRQREHEGQREIKRVNPQADSALSVEPSTGLDSMALRS